MWVDILDNRHSINTREWARGRASDSFYLFILIPKKELQIPSESWQINIKVANFTWQSVIKRMKFKIEIIVDKILFSKQKNFKSEIQC